MGNDMFNDEQLAHAEIVQKETEDALGFWKDRALKAEAALAALSRARETDGAVREAAERLNATGEEMARLDENNVADSFAALHVLAPRFIREAKALLSALSSPPRPETKDDEPDPVSEADPLRPVCLECSFASGGHVHVVRADGSKAVRYPFPHEWNGALRTALIRQPPADAATEAVNRLSPIATEPVARAAEIVRERLRIYGNTSTYLYDCPGLVAEVTDLLDALAAPAPAPAPSAKETKP